MQGYERICSESGTSGEKCLKFLRAVGNPVAHPKDASARAMTPAPVLAISAPQLHHVVGVVSTIEAHVGLDDLSVMVVVVALEGRLRDDQVVNQTRDRFDRFGASAN